MSRNGRPVGVQQVSISTGAWLTVTVCGIPPLLPALLFVYDSDGTNQLNPLQVGCLACQNAPVFMRPQAQWKKNPMEAQHPVPVSSFGHSSLSPAVSAAV